ncbi:MAG: prenyltransferase/squalene oxidase repeat-containing protein [Phycisphaeraceae bacterium]
MIDSIRIALAVLILSAIPAHSALAADDDKFDPLKGPKPRPITPLTQDEIRSSLDRAQKFLIKTQNDDGSWGGPTQTKGLNIMAGVPGSHHAFRIAVTALSVSAFIETGTNTSEARDALEKAEKVLIEELPKVRRFDNILIYNIWTHFYGIQALVRMHDRLPDDKDRQAKMKDLIKQQIGMLEKYESVDGGWGYYDFDIGAKKPASSSTSFCNAAGLVALHEAKQIGIEVPEKLVKRALDATVRQRKPDFSYLYGEYMKMAPMYDINRPGGSLGRSQACNIALRIWGDKKITDEVLKVWLDRLYARNDWLGIGRKRPVPHESWFAVAGYFYYFGHYYAALCIDVLPAEDRPHFQQHLARIIADLQEKDGSWWDYPFYNYHQPYGTAFAMMTLQRCLEKK